MSEHRASDTPPGANMLLWAALLVFVSVLLGGASRDNPLRLALVEVASLPLLFAALRSLAAEGMWRSAWPPVLILAAVIVLPLAQLVPLPPEVWTRLPTHAAMRGVLETAGLPLGWRPLSLSPDDTWRSALSLVPPAAMFLGALRLHAVDVKLLSALWVLLALASVILGAFQVLSPSGGPVFLYDVTNIGTLVGFFANRNHQASLLLALLPLAALHAADLRRRQGARGLIPALAWAYFLVALIALGSVKSRAGLLLAGPAMMGALAVLWRAAPQGPGRRRTLLGLGAVGGLSVVGILLLVLAPTLQRFGTDANAEQRLLSWPYVVATAEAQAPLGSGIGSFDRVFRAAEPLDLVQPTYLNHAHNDYLEVWLEAGWPGVALIVAGLVWLAFAGLSAWRAPGGEENDARRAASVAVGVFAAHSFVDYPLRTETLMVLMALCCGVLAWGGQRGAQRAP